MPETTIRVTKDGQTLSISSLALEEHLVMGWVVLDEVADEFTVADREKFGALTGGEETALHRHAGGLASYLVYTALLTQTGTGAPVATVLENTLGVDLVWTRESAGSYLATATEGTFPEHKWWAASFTVGYENDAISFTYMWVSTGLLALISQNSAINTDFGSGFGLPLPIEIRVYPAPAE